MPFIWPLQWKNPLSYTYLLSILCCSLAKINDLWDGFMDQGKVRGLVPCCGQDGYRAQVLQHPKDTYNI